MGLSLGPAAEATKRIKVGSHWAPGWDPRYDVFDFFDVTLMLSYPLPAEVGPEVDQSLHVCVNDYNRGLLKIRAPWWSLSHGEVTYFFVDPSRGASRLEGWGTGLNYCSMCGSCLFRASPVRGWYIPKDFSVIVTHSSDEREPFWKP